MAQNMLASALKGYPEDMYHLGRAFERGEFGVEKSADEALKWYLLSASLGFFGAQHHLGWMYANGRGVEQSDAEAVKWYRLAADQGNSDALRELQKLAASSANVTAVVGLSLQVYSPDNAAEVREVVASF